MSALESLYAPSPSEAEKSSVTVPLAADAVIYGGAIVAVDSNGYAVAGSDTTGLTVIGKAHIRGGTVVDNTDGDDGDKSVVVRLSRGSILYIYDNDTGAPLTQAHFGKSCVVKDDHTISSNTTNDISAGTFMGFPLANDGTPDTSKAYLKFAN